MINTSLFIFDHGFHPNQDELGAPRTRHRPSGHATARDALRAGEIG
jgi:hypothetical protein